ncbi:MAG: GNAT family N-acetyltransferase [Armatimonadetes bacterium]|nr:GNAT family N-acetyltransferase [Armatimonadota bacterium]
MAGASVEPVSAPEPVVRPARWRHLWGVRRLNRQLFPEPYAFWRFVGYQLSSQGWIWVAEQGDDIVGYAVLTLSLYSEPRRMVGEIISIATVPEVRRQGVARGMLRQALSRAWERGVGQVYLQVAVDNDAAQRLYRAEGFTVERRLKGYYLNGDDAWLMVVARPKPA